MIREHRADEAPDISRCDGESECDTLAEVWLTSEPSPLLE
jgi:hypothetical protein